MTVTQSKIKIIEKEFPIIFTSLLAEHESWRKELYRPIYHIHKWWANRLGSVFRAIIIGSCSYKDDVKSQFYSKVKFPNVTIFDPFMGSGTTVGEAIKLGCRAIGRDINPISLLMTTASLQPYSREEVEKTFQNISEKVSGKIKSLYLTKLENGKKVDVLYYFWVKVLSCPSCNSEIELFKSRIFAKNVYPRKHPEAKACCPSCRDINSVHFNDSKAICKKCGETYNPQIGTVKKSTISCPYCKMDFKLIDVIRKHKKPLREKMYAKLVLNHDGKKSYHSISKLDEIHYRRCEKILKKLWHNIPKNKIEQGHNTKQVLNYNYRYWYQMFNVRQLVCIAHLLSEIKKIKNPSLKLLFACLFSGTLEFNNMFTSFKGEGTGAVRHMFAHHILKPELMPIEGDLWGITKSSGSFSSLFRTRILRALDYKINPFELMIKKSNNRTISSKIFGLSDPVNKRVVSSYHDFTHSNGVYLSTGDSSKTDLGNNSVDLVLTDPPFFDNVHYSELADFFYVWIKKILELPWTKKPTTRSSFEVQSTSSDSFSDRLASVFLECNRVLKNNGLLVFTYHHSKKKGWIALYSSLRKAGFLVLRTFPVKSEMSVAVPILQTKDPITYDLIVVCKKTQNNLYIKNSPANIIPAVINETTRTIKILRNGSLKITQADMKVILMGCIFSELSRRPNIKQEIISLEDFELMTECLNRKKL